MHIYHKTSLLIAQPNIYYGYYVVAMVTEN